jgi:anti-sigma factor RsiW
MSAAMLQCPNDLDERMELYCLDRMHPAEARELENHVATCPACLYEMLGTDFFLESLVSALHECEEGRPE